MSGQPDDQNGKKPMPDIPLSAAFLAPLNSIFEAQIHAARSFLNFLLKMGFRHVYTDDDIAEMKSQEADLEKKIGNEKRKSNSDQELIDKMEKQLQELKRGIAQNESYNKDRDDMKKLFKKRRELAEKDEKLSVEEIGELKKLNARSGDLFHQSYDYINNDGNELTVAIPNLALLPVKPMSIQEASLDFEFQVNKVEAWQTKDDGERKRPWFLINEPKSLRGEFAARKNESTESTIQIKMKIESSEMPAGLEKLMVHLTNSIESIDAIDD